MVHLNSLLHFGMQIFHLVQFAQLVIYDPFGLEPLNVHDMATDVDLLMQFREEMEIIIRL